MERVHIEIWDDVVPEVAAFIKPKWVKDGFDWECGSQKGFKDESGWELDDVPEVEVSFELYEETTIAEVLDLSKLLTGGIETHTNNDEMKIRMFFTEPYAQAFGTDVRMVCRLDRVE